VTRFDLLARFARFLNLVVAQAIHVGPSHTRWMAEGWTYAYSFELGLLNDGLTYDEFHREWEAA
jgi:hypothetical protein